MTDQKELPIYQKGGRYFKDKACSVNYADQDTASILWQLKRSLDESRVFERPSAPPRRIGVQLLLLLLVICALGMVVVSVVYWWPDLIHRFTNPAPPPTSAMSLAQAQQAMSDELKSYSDRVSDLEKLISVLLGLSAIYTISLGLSSWASVQSNLQQAEKWIQVQQSITKDLKDQAEKSVEKLESLLLRHEAGLASIQDEITYAKAIQSASASLALAVQGKFVSDAELAIKDLVELRAKAPTNRVLNLYLGRTYKVLGRLKNAVDAMTVFIKSKESAQQIHDGAAADAYYNRACYRSLLWGKGTSAERLLLQDEIVKDINEFRLIDETLTVGIPQDTDFDAVRAEKWFTDALK
jgi:hypothetical protein